VYTHEKYFTKKYSVHLLFFLLLTFSIISVRYNIINSIHNFSLTNTINQYLYYLNGLFVLVIANIVYKIFYKYITQPNTTINYYNTSIIINLLILLFIYYTINYFNIKIFMYNLTYINLLKIIFFIITIFFLDFFYYGFVVLFLFFCTNTLCMYILVVGVILTAMQQNNSKINYYTHLVLLFFLCLSTLQYYIFCNNTTFFDYGVINLWLLKFNQFTTTIYNIQCADHYYHLNNTLISFLFDVQTNMVAVIKGTAMENIFGKNITTHDSIYIEKINQTDNQLFISFIFYQIFLVLFFLVLFFLVLFFSKNRTTYI